jgi:hypothetical protein
MTVLADVKPASAVPVVTQFNISALGAFNANNADLTQAVLASLLGATREAVGRHLVRWRDAGWIALRYGRVTILAPAVLNAIANGEPIQAEAPRSIGQKKVLVRAS